MTMTTDQTETVQLLALHAINHDGKNYPPYSLLTVSAADANRLIEADAAQPADLERDVPIEDRAPAGMVAINKTIGQPSTSFMPALEFKKLQDKQRAESR
jgi:hypothetical protein